MELILNTNDLGYKPFLNSNVDSLIIGLKDFCVNQPFSLTIKQLISAIEEIKRHNKKIYLSINDFVLEKNITKLKSIISKTIPLSLDGYIVSDLGVLNIFKEYNLANKVTLDLQTYITNKYSASALLNLGVEKVCLSKEITLEDIQEISTSNKNKIDLLGYGYFPITYSKRPILKCYFRKNKIKQQSSLYYIKEESRTDFYPIYEEKNCLLVYNHKPYSLFNNLEDVMKLNVSSLRIDTIFLSEKEIKELINIYSTAINAIRKKNCSTYLELKKTFNEQYTFDSPFLYNSSFLLKDGDKQ